MSIQRVSKVFYSGEYAHNHWAMQPCFLSQPNMVALATFKECEYAAYLHPTDKRGCRLIVVLKCDADMPSTFNREYNSQERIGLGLVVQLMQEVYSAIFPIAQAVNAGNNAQQFDKDKGLTLLGTPNEPLRLNAHVFGRGNPNEQYIKGVKLDGPEPGEIFNLRADGQEPGNDRPIPWTRTQTRQTVAALKLQINRKKVHYENESLIIYTSGTSKKRGTDRESTRTTKKIKSGLEGNNLVNSLRKLSSSDGQ